MHDYELKMGDLILYADTLGQMEHVALYVGHKDQLPYVVHATTGEYKAVMLTRLKQPDQGCSYHVMRPRCQDEVIKATVAILLRWVECQVPYKYHDELNFQLDEVRGLEGEKAPKIQESFGKQHFEARFPYYFEMANALPLTPLDKNGCMTGMFCSEVIIAAFNVAQIVLHEILLQSMDSPQWALPPTLALSVLIKNLNSPLPFDAEMTLPAGMHQHCLGDTCNWQDGGPLMIEPMPDLDLDKVKPVWKEFKQSLREDAPVKVQQLLQLPGNSFMFFESSLRGSPTFISISSLSNDEQQGLRNRTLSSPAYFLGLDG